ncbi:tyrosine-type recombinase/integrase [Halofilum ochraceum]|uniref:tyrosine-type recombinase/integrase n=1 Tax=Halofilum ochraceum TaxID=1611323 RepID=UPI0008DA598C|nr:tyrosine-type recombinase/integrase [Halofilum ochraceum]
MENPLLVAVDVGSRFHEVAVGDSFGGLLDGFRIDHDAAGLATFFDRIEDQSSSCEQAVHVAMEGYNGWARPLDAQVLERGWALYNVNNLLNPLSPRASLRFSDVFSPVPRRNRAAITEPDAFGGLLRAMDGYDGEPSTNAALHLLALTFVRPGELRFAAWPEFDLKGAIWGIPGARMEMGREHIVPLAPEAIVHLRRLHPVTGPRPYVFEGNRPGRPIPENTAKMALKTMGYSADQVTAHGFRSTASTLLHEMGWPPEVIELQLSHAQRSQVAAAYNRSARLEEHQKMTLAWAESLDKLRGAVKTSLDVSTAAPPIPWRA